jgi:hypothetical protein
MMDTPQGYVADEIIDEGTKIARSIFARSVELPGYRPLVSFVVGYLAAEVARDLRARHQSQERIDSVRDYLLTAVRNGFEVGADIEAGREH